MSIHRIFVRKREGFAHEATSMYQTIRTELNIPVKAVTIYERYDIEGVSDEDLAKAKQLIFSEPPVDELFDTLPQTENTHIIATEYVPGQYDQRADSAEQCLAMLTLKSGATVRTARVFALEGDLSADDLARIKHYYINPVDSREASLELPTSLALDVQPPKPVESLENFITADETALKALRQELGLAMSDADLALIQDYFANTEKRNPTITEIRVLDTYWSDHCRHTTFMTELTNITIDDTPATAPIRAALDEYMAGRGVLYTSRKKARTLMDMATLAVKELRAQGGLKEIDESEEINACTIVVPVDVNGKTEEWLLLFKNETHNHPTEIEPYGGAATCLGGCIRDPLSGRAYVYQAMRVTGSGNLLTPLDETLEGKLPQVQITTGAARGYSSYGNQIGLATGEVREYYHPSYVAKRMEIGAVIGAAPRTNVRREEPVPGDIVVLLGGQTGRDGCGGATGSSKEHDLSSLASCGAEIQKGNPLTERKIQRLFRRPEVTTLIKRCNDFGAGGVSVAIGELTDGLLINLDTVPKKYEGLDGTELAISESQERMACVIAKKDWDAFQKYCDEENLEATIVADVTDSNRLTMTWQGVNIVDISRDFLYTNGAEQHQKAHVASPVAGYYNTPAVTDLKAHWLDTMKDLAVTSQQGLGERFDSTIGAGTVLMPFSGLYQKTPVQGMAAKLPVLHAETTTASLMTHGFDPFLSEWSPFHGAQQAILLAVAKIVALGGDRSTAYLTLQEYFERLNQDETAWGKPVAALLGAYKAQKELGIGAIGGKDSMSGTFMDLTVPPTLVAFAVTTAHVDNILTPHFKEAGHKVLHVDFPRKEDDTPDFDVFKAQADRITKEARAGKVAAAYVVEAGGIAAAITKMALGDRIGVELNDDVKDLLFAPHSGSWIIETDEATAAAWAKEEYVTVLGTLTKEPAIKVAGTELALADLEAAYESTLAPIFPLTAKSGQGEAVAYIHDQKAKPRQAPAIAKPRVVIPVFPGTNCEYDSALAFERAGGEADIVIIRNRTVAELEESIQEMKRKLDEAQIVFFPGGFSAGDEPDGSGKFMATLFRNPYLSESLHNLLHNRDGLALGICNGFQALIKLGLLPYGEIAPMTADSPTLTYNTIGRHLSGMVRTKVISTKSPWMSLCKAGEIYTIPISHGEGRFIASPAQVVEFNRKGQIATQYVDLDGIASYDARYNPNQSVAAIEGLFSPDGRVFGKMGHIERTGHGISKNVPGKQGMPVFASGVAYFK
ncbi:phosphoribosylformylglycinamidine synthase [uncultured Veillonella sp.]|uniref:phosphoribosylformylglycinamidine synthase n=1 Tax=uncultured Veillonella sp. TaxID=159268 RepID=UPI002673307D|nr:phosphoribosylformylglycinamidine synthase [uncultured Veillonella sp.]